MTILLALFLGIIQGLTEFLPVSSSGHLLLFEHIFGLPGGNYFFNILVHFATLIAVVIVFWKDISYLIKHPLSRGTLTIVVASVVTAVIALVIKTFVSEFLLSALLGYGFLLTAAILLVINFAHFKGTTKQIGYKEAAIIGAVQGIAVLPGLSRSGSTIGAALMLKADREEAAKFSFLISLPVILGGMVFEVIDGVKSGFEQVNVFAYIVGFLAALGVALLTIKFMMKLVKKGKWWHFAIYLVLLCTFVLLNQYWLGLF